MKPTIPKGYPASWPNHPPLLANPVWQQATHAERHLHLAASRVLGHDLPLPYTYVERQLWFDFTRAGYGIVEFIAVVAWRKARNAEAKKQFYSLRLTTLLESLSNFADDLHQARKGAPRQPVAPCEELIQILPEGGQRRVEIAPTTPEPQRIDPAEALANLRSLREQAGLRSRRARTPETDPTDPANATDPKP